MKAVERLEKRKSNWNRLEVMVTEFATSRSFTPNQVMRFTALYRSVCADLALADAYELPPGTVAYLHRLVARAHHQLYRAKGFRMRTWGKLLLEDVPRRVFHDRCVQFCFVFFWGLFLLSGYMAYRSDLFPNYVEETLGEGAISQLENNFSEPLGDQPFSARFFMAAFYIQHNTTIGLKSFASALLLVPGLLVLKFNAVALGASFGYMARPDTPGTDNFFEFVTAHGPFELTAIVLAAGAGLKLGYAWIRTNGYSRIDSLKHQVKESMPIMGSSMLLFFGAAMIEGFLSPSVLPYVVKGGVAIVTSLMLVTYFIVLGMRPEVPDGA